MYHKAMLNMGRKEAGILFLGDILIYFASLWIALALRHLAVPTANVYLLHLKPFLILFLIWTVVFYISGLYEKHTLVFKSKLPSLIFTAQVINSLLGVLFFYLIPVFSITPKTVLFIDLAFTFVLLVFWRLYLSERVTATKRQNALLIGSGDEMQELWEEVNQNPRYRFRFLSALDLDAIGSVDFKGEILDRIYSEKITMIVIDLKNEKSFPILPHLYNLLFSRVHFFDLHRVYEDIFDRVPLSLVGYNWFLENISSASKISYDILKRAMDIAAALLLGIPSLVFYPFVYLAIKLDDGGSVFLHQERVGKNNSSVWLLKFRTMTFDDKGKWGKSGQTNKVTRVGEFLRKSRIDELPQLWNVLKGDISLIGPRPEFPDPVREYESKVPYYGVRHLIKPGLSGWAQVHHMEHPHHQLDMEETRRKLSYDLYYIKNRSLVLDIKTALMTVRIMLARSGR